MFRPRIAVSLADLEENEKGSDAGLALLCWSALERYSPRSAESLAAAREKREEKTVERQAQEHPLFADAIRSGEWRPERGKGR